MRIPLKMMRPYFGRVFGVQTKENRVTRTVPWPGLDGRLQLAIDYRSKGVETGG